VTFSTDGNRVYSAAPDGAVRMWDRGSAGAAPALLLSARMPAPTSGRGGGDLRRMALSADGTRIALFAALGVDTRVWDVRRPADPPLPLPDTAATRAGRGSTAPFRAMSFSPDGSALAVVRAGAGTISLWDLRDLSIRSLLVRNPSEAPAPPTLAVYSSDGSRLVTGNSLEARIWELRKPDAPPLVIPHPPQQRLVDAIALSKDNRRLAVGTEDVRVRDLRNPARPPLLLRGFPGQGVGALAFSPEGELLAGGTWTGYHGTTQLWDLRNPTTPPVSLPGPVSSIAFAPDGQHLVVGGNDGSVRLWSLGSAAADYLCTRVWRNLSMDEWRLYVGESIPYERTCPGLPPGAGVPGRAAAISAAVASGSSRP
jgi:WD40 repeat protein